MARRRQPPGRKRRTREHVVADLGVNFVERAVLLCGHTAARTTSDYGIDLVIETFGPHGDYELGSIRVQVKSSEAVATTADGRAVRQRVAVADLKSWLFDIMPVILVTYDARNEIAYWLDVQEYARGADLDMVNAVNVTLRIPASARWTPDVVEQLREVKNRLVARSPWRFIDEG